MGIKNKIICDDIAAILEADLPWKKFKNKSILISGGNGFIASYIIKTLLKANIKYKLGLKLISLIRENKNSKIKNDNLKVIKVDLANFDNSCLPKTDIVIHAASKASPKYFAKQTIDIIKTNTLATINLLEYAKKIKSEKFLYISSGEIYGEIENYNSSIKEDFYGKINHLNKRSVYAESKKLGELICNSYTENNKLKILIARPFHTYGPGVNLKDGRVFADFVNSVVNQKDILLKSKGDSKRPFCYITDAIVGLFTVLLKGRKSNAYNIANPNCEVKIKDLAIVIANLIPDKRVNVKFTKKKHLSNPLKRQNVSIEKIKSLNWFPKVGIYEGFERTIQFYMNDY